ncbi:MAG: hypothetical protein NVSMB12_17880 [Acidimicrobiales bacterium]
MRSSEGLVGKAGRALTVSGDHHIALQHGTRSFLCHLSHRPRPARSEGSAGIGSVGVPRVASTTDMGSLIKKRRKRMRKKKHKKMLKATRWQRRAGK